MKQIIVARLVDFLEKKSAFRDEEDREKIKYILSVMVRELWNVIVLCLIFGIFGVGDKFLMSLLVVMLTRTFAGGVHEENCIRCSIHTTIFFSISICLSLWNKIVMGMWIVVLILFVLFIVFAPVNTKYRGYISKHKRRKMKLCGIGGLFLSAGIAILCEKYAGIITGTLIVEMLVSLAEGYADKTASTFVWGEEEMPKCLRQKQTMDEEEE